MSDARIPAVLLPLLRWPAEQQRRRRILSLVGATDGLRCLDIGGADGGLGWFLRQQGGDWSSLDPEASGREELSSLIDAPVQGLDEGHLPFPDETFDVIVVADRLETTPDRDVFVRECHRVLKPAGRLILHTTRSLTPKRVRKDADTDDQDPPLGRAVGFTESELFEALKDGFDVQDIHAYGRLFSQSADHFGWRWVEKSKDPATMARWAFVPIWLFSQLDVLLFFTRGRRIVLRAKRRLWIPRKRPVLRDGRSIAEATLKTRIGTASPLSVAKRS